MTTGSTNGEFAGKVVIVIGGARGIGYSTAALFAGCAATVVIADLDGQRAAEAAASITARSAANVSAITVDLRNGYSIEAAIARIMDSFGKIDVLVNSAGIYPKAKLVDTSDAMMTEIFEVNLFGPFKAARAAVPHMLRAGGGCIVNVISGTAFRPVPKLGAYAASKGALVALSRNLALELAPDVRVNLVAPGPTDVEPGGAGGARSPLSTEEAASPMRRRAKPDEVAEAIVFMASDRAGFVTGQTLHVNGGRWMS